MENTTPAIISHREMSEQDMRNHAIDPKDYDGTNQKFMLATFADGGEFWYTANTDGTFWTQACNQDEIFNSADAAARWVYIQMNGKFTN